MAVVGTNDYSFALSMTRSVSDGQTESVVAQRFTSFSLGLLRGPVFSVFVEGVQATISSQIAVKLAFDAMLREIFAEIPRRRSPVASELIQKAFRRANIELFEYAHRMISGARISASGFIAVFDGERFTIGRVGAYESFLLRDGQVLRFFPNYPAAQLVDRHHQNLIGQQTAIPVELTVFEAKLDDALVITTYQGQEGLGVALSQILQESNALCGEKPLEKILNRFQGEVCPRPKGTKYLTNAALAMFQVGSRPIRLEKEIVNA